MPAAVLSSGGPRSDETTGTDPDDLVAFMMKYDIPITRENYLYVAFFGELPDPWTAEHEADVPRELQDPSKL